MKTDQYLINKAFHTVLQYLMQIRLKGPFMSPCEFQKQALQPGLEHRRYESAAEIQISSSVSWSHCYFWASYSVHGSGCGSQKIGQWNTQKQTIFQWPIEQNSHIPYMSQTKTYKPSFVYTALLPFTLDSPIPTSFAEIEGKPTFLYCIHLTRSHDTLQPVPQWLSTSGLFSELAVAMR